MIQAEIFCKKYTGKVRLDKVWFSLNKHLHRPQPGLTKNLHRPQPGLTKNLHRPQPTSTNLNRVSLKPQLHWASLLAARRRVYNLLVNSPSVIMPASKLAACKKADSKVEHV